MRDRTKRWVRDTLYNLNYHLRFRKITLMVMMGGVEDRTKDQGSFLSLL